MSSHSNQAAASMGVCSAERPAWHGMHHAQLTPQHARNHRAPGLLHQVGSRVAAGGGQLAPQRLKGAHQSRHRRTGLLDVHVCGYAQRQGGTQRDLDNQSGEGC